MRSHLRPVLISVFPLLAACYTYAPIDLASVPPGSSVRARVSGATADQLEPLLGIPDARLLNGIVIESRADTMILEVPTVLRTDVGGATQTLHQRVSIPRSGLLELEARKLDRFRTVAVVGGSTVLVGAFVIKSLIADPGKEPLPGGGGAEIRWP